ncbi:MAG: PhaM family polyhydroxyalkanoate granule multifunctional regulatory protein, partial [Usitatibacteraceae bacterium]
DYFALFQSMLNPAAANPAAAAPSMFAMLDPKEFERKISELETVLTWLKGTVGMVELSLQTLKYQQSVLASLGEAGKNAQSDANAAGPNLEALAKSASAMNPALWAWNMMQTPAATPAESSASKSGAKKKPSARKSR